MLQGTRILLIRRTLVITPALWGEYRRRPKFALVCFSPFSLLWARFISIRVKESMCTCTSGKIERRSHSFLLGAGLLELTSVVVERSSRCLLNRVSLKIRRGEVLGVIGLNGSGKSVLLQLISGLIKPDRGRVQFRGEEQTRNPILLRKSVVMCSGQSQAVGKLTVAAWVEYLVYIHGMHDNEQRPKKR